MLRIFFLVWTVLAITVLISAKEEQLGTFPRSFSQSDLNGRKLDARHGNSNSDSMATMFGDDSTSQDASNVNEEWLTERGSDGLESIQQITGSGKNQKVDCVFPELQEVHTFTPVKGRSSSSSIPSCQKLMSRKAPPSDWKKEKKPSSSHSAVNVGIGTSGPKMSTYESTTDKAGKIHVKSTAGLGGSSSFSGSFPSIDSGSKKIKGDDCHKCSLEKEKSKNESSSSPSSSVEDDDEKGIDSLPVSKGNETSSTSSSNSSSPLDTQNEKKDCDKDKSKTEGIDSLPTGSDQPKKDCEKCTSSTDSSSQPAPAPPKGLFDSLPFGKPSNSSSSSNADQSKKYCEDGASAKGITDSSSQPAPPKGLFDSLPFGNSSNSNSSSSTPPKGPFDSLPSSSSSGSEKNPKDCDKGQVTDSKSFSPVSMGSNSSSPVSTGSIPKGKEEDCDKDSSVTGDSEKSTTPSDSKSGSSPSISSGSSHKPSLNSTSSPLSGMGKSPSSSSISSGGEGGEGGKSSDLQDSDLGSGSSKNDSPLGSSSPSLGGKEKDCEDKKPSDIDSGISSGSPIKTIPKKATSGSDLIPSSSSTDCPETSTSESASSKEEGISSGSPIGSSSHSSKGGTGISSGGLPSSSSSSTKECESCSSTKDKRGQDSMGCGPIVSPNKIAHLVDPYKSTSSSSMDPSQLSDNRLKVSIKSKDLFQLWNNMNLTVDQFDILSKGLHTLFSQGKMKVESSDDEHNSMKSDSNHKGGKRSISVSELSPDDRDDIETFLLSPSSDNQSVEENVPRLEQKETTTSHHVYHRQLFKTPSFLKKRKITTQSRIKP